MIYWAHMIRGRGDQISIGTAKQQGYTIIEVLIFLAVSSVLFVSTMIYLSGRQQQVQFTNATRDFETKLIDVANDVANGYYQTTAGVGCDPAGNISTSGTVQGSNKECIFLGRFIKLAGPDAEHFTIYSMIGKRTVDSVDIISLSQASPRLLLTPDDSKNTSLREEDPFGYGSRVACVGLGDSCNPATTSNAGIAFITRLDGSTGANTTGGAIKADVYYYPSIEFSTPEDGVGNSLRTLVDNAPTNAKKLTGKLTICVLSGSTAQYSLISIGTDNGGNTNISSAVKEGSTCS